MKRRLVVLSLLAGMLLIAGRSIAAQAPEHLDRGLIAVDAAPGEV